MDRGWTGIVAAFLGLCGTLAACGGPAKEGVQGAACFRAAECAPGLVCIGQVCTSDLSSVVLHEEAGAAGGAMIPAGDAAIGAGDGASGGGGSPAGGGAGGGASGSAGGGGKGGAAGGGGKGGAGGAAGAGGSAMAGMAGAGLGGSGNANDASAE